MENTEPGYKFIDPSTHRKKQMVKNTLRFIGDVPVFSIVEFNLFGTCTRRCPFCPISSDAFKKTNNAIDVDLYAKIMKDLSEIEYNGKILFSAFSEPLLHKRIKDLFKLTKTHLPHARMEIVSNGDLFERTNLRELFDSGLDTMSVSVYDGPEQLQQLKKLTDGYGLTEEQVIFRRRYMENGNYGITISNRTGLVDSNKFRDVNEAPVVELPLKSRCFYPFYMTLVDYTGDMLLCPHDWKKASKVGNLGESHIWDLWKSKYLNTVRAKLAGADRRFSPCNTCDVKGDVLGRENFEAWSKQLNFQP